MKHIAVACCLAWGHARSVCCLVASLINADEDVTITLIMAALGAELCKTELKRCGVLDSAHLRIITVGKTSGYEEVLQPFLEMPSLIIPVLDTLVAEAAVGEYEALRRPTMLISDHYLYEATDHGKRLGMSTWTYSTGSPGAIYQCVGTWQYDVPFIRTAHRCLSLDKDEVPEVLVAEGQPTLYSYEIQPSSWPGEGESPLTVPNSLISTICHLEKEHRRFAKPARNASLAMSTTSSSASLASSTPKLRPAPTLCTQDRVRRLSSSDHNTLRLSGARPHLLAIPSPQRSTSRSLPSFRLHKRGMAGIACYTSPSACVLSPQLLHS